MFILMICRLLKEVDKHQVNLHAIKAMPVRFGDEFVGTIVKVNKMQVKILKKLGEGGSAYVYSVKDVVTGEKYALKRFVVNEESRAAAVRQEINLTRECGGHPDFVRHVASGEQLLVMEECGGGDLAAVLRRRPGAGLGPGNVCVVMAALGRALLHLHTRHTPVTHRWLAVDIGFE